MLSLILPSIDKDSVNIALTENKIQFSGKCGFAKDEYSLTLNLFDLIDPSKSNYSVEGRCIKFFLQKQEEKWWKTLIQEGKAKYIKIDWEKWREEDDPEIPGLDFPIEVPDPASLDVES